MAGCARACAIVAVVVGLGACKKPAPEKSSSECALETACTKVTIDGGAPGDASGDASDAGAAGAPRDAAVTAPD